MKINKLKKKFIFSLITLTLCCAILYSANSNYNITGYISTKIEIVKEKEMKFMFGERNALGDRYSESSLGYNINNVGYEQDAVKTTNITSISNYDFRQQGYFMLQNQYINSNTSLRNYFGAAAQYQATLEKLKKQVDEDSYRNKNLDLYYIFDYEYTMDALKELDPVIEKTAEAQKTPKALVAAVLFREMMFTGQEDLLDGLDFIGGKSMGICQIGIKNARYNEQTVHGKKSLIASKTDDEIKTMLQNPKQAIYFCSVQLRARAIKLTNDKNINLNKLNKAQLHKILEDYNQSKISKTIGPVKTKAKYAEETYKYYELFKKYYELEQAK